MRGGVWGGKQDRTAVNRDNGEGLSFLFSERGGIQEGREGDLDDGDSDGGSKPDQLASMYVGM